MPPVTCGNDLLIGSAAGNTMYGDARVAAGVVACGNDRLVSGTSNEMMWGDVELRQPGAVVTTGADVFVFRPGNGQDHVDLTGFAGSGLHGFAGLSWQVVSGDTVIALPGGGHVTLAGVGGIVAGDFLFS